MNTLSAKRIVLGITGGIAAYKCPELVRMLTQSGAEVKVILTESASHFTTAETLHILSGHRVYQTCLDESNLNPVLHIELARWAEVILIAPATAHFIAKLAHGYADDLLSTVCLAAESPVIVLPAMNKIMWLNPAVQSNITLLKSRAVSMWGPDEGIQACGDTGPGRMLEIEEVIQNLIHLFSPKYLGGKKILITAGPTQELLDPVRYLSNYSSGKMGYALAEAASEAGAEVTLISGPTNLICDSAISTIEILTAVEMHRAVMNHLSNCDIFISAAAVSDYRFESTFPQKIKKNRDKFAVTLLKNPDILSEVSKLSPKTFTVGFAAETENLGENAYEKLKNKNLDMIIANLVGKDKGFQSDYNEIFIITKQLCRKLNYAPKKLLSRELLKFIYYNVHENSST